MLSLHTRGIDWHCAPAFARAISVLEKACDEGHPITLSLTVDMPWCTLVLPGAVERQHSMITLQQKCVYRELKNSDPNDREASAIAIQLAEDLIHAADYIVNNGGKKWLSESTSHKCATRSCLIRRESTYDRFWGIWDCGPVRGLHTLMMMDELLDGWLLDV